MSKLLLPVALIGLACAAPASAQICRPVVPAAPDPVPAQFDWRPMAKAWCSQLAACGLKSPSCVADFVKTAKAAAANPPPTGAAPGVVTGEATATIDLQCTDTEEYHAGELTCGAQQQRRQAPPQERRSPEGL